MLNCKNGSERARQDLLNLDKTAENGWDSQLYETVTFFLSLKGVLHTF